MSDGVSQSSQLQVGQPQTVIRLAKLLILGQRLLVHDGGFFVLGFGEKLVPVIDVTLRLDLGIGTAGRQRQ